MWFISSQASRMINLVELSNSKYFSVDVRNEYETEKRIACPSGLVIILPPCGSHSNSNTNREWCLRRADYRNWRNPPRRDTGSIVILMITGIDLEKVVPHSQIVPKLTNLKKTENRSFIIMVGSPNEHENCHCRCANDAGWERWLCPLHTFRPESRGQTSFQIFDGFWIRVSGRISASEYAKRQLVVLAPAEIRTRMHHMINAKVQWEWYLP